MAVSIEVREFTIPAGTGNVDFTGFSFQPKACLFFLTGNASQNADSASADGMRLAIGMCDGTRQWAMCTGEEDAQATSDVGRRSTTTGCILWADEGGGSQIVQGKATFVSFLATGVQVNRLPAFRSTASPLLKIVAFGGTDVSVFGDLVAPSTTLGGTVTVTPGFEADVVIAAMIGKHTDADGNTENDDHSWSLGWAVNPDRQATNNQFCHAGCAQDGQAASQSDMSIHTNRCAVSRQDDAVDPGAEITAFDATTFTVTTRDEAALANDRVGFLALNLGGANANVFSVNQDMPTATGSQSQAGTTFTPIFLLGLAIGDNRAFNTWAAADAQNSSVGVLLADGTRTFAAAAWTDDAADPSNCACRIRDTHVWSLDNQAGILISEASFTSFNANGWTFDFTTKDAVAEKAVYLAIGDVAAGGIVEADGSASGSASSSVAGAMTATTVLNAAGIARSAIAAATLWLVAASAAGVAAVDAPSAQVAASTATVAGVGDATAVAAAIWRVDAASAGVGSLDGISGATILAAAESAGVADASGVGAATAVSSGASAGGAGRDVVGAALTLAGGAISGA